MTLLKFVHTFNICRCYNSCLEISPNDAAAKEKCSLAKKKDFFLSAGSIVVRSIDEGLPSDGICNQLRLSRISGEGLFKLGKYEEAFKIFNNTIRDFDMEYRFSADVDIVKISLEEVRIQRTDRLNTWVDLLPGLKTFRLNLLVNRAQAALKLGNYEQSIKDCNEFCLSGGPPAMSRDFIEGVGIMPTYLSHPSFYRCLFIHAYCLLNIKKYQEALPHWEKSYNFVKEIERNRFGSTEAFRALYNRNPDIRDSSSDRPLSDFHPPSWVVLEQ